MIKLIYTGGGHGGALIGVPARDLTEQEARTYGMDRLVQSGLYKRVLEDKAARPDRETKTGPKE